MKCDRMGCRETDANGSRAARPRLRFAGRLLRAGAIACAVLASTACATEGGPATIGADLFDEPAAASTPPSAAADPADRTGLGGDPETLRDQGEAAYRARRFDEAVALYERLVAAQPSDARAWLRLGNIHHQRRDWFKALRAYRRAAARTRAGVETDPAVRAKALYNLALVNLELARQTLRTLERMGEVGAVAGDTESVARAIERTQHALESIASRGPVVTPLAEPRARSGPQTVSSSPKGSASPISSSQRARPDRAAPGIRASQRETLPVVDYIRGEPRP